MIAILIAMTFLNIAGVTWFLWSYFKKLQTDWALKFAQMELKFKGVVDNVSGVFAELSEVKREINQLQPAYVEELEMRIENLEIGAGIQKSFTGGRPTKEYRPKYSKNKADAG